MSNKSCPVSLSSVDANIIRIGAVYILLLFSTYLVIGNVLILDFLIFDFMIRLFFIKEHSLIYMISKKTKEILHIKKNVVDAAPKRLAMYFGFSFLIIIAILSALDFILISYIFSAILLVCIALEVLFSYCLGCEIYHLYKKSFV